MLNARGLSGTVSESALYDPLTTELGNDLLAWVMAFEWPTVVLLVRRAQLAGAYRRRHDLQHWGRDDLADVDARIRQLEAQLPADLIAEARRLREPSVAPVTRGFGE